MTSDSIIKKDLEDQEKKRVKELINNIEKLYPCNNKFLYPDNYYTIYAKGLRNDSRKNNKVNK